jgi:hypothetical protein
MSRAEPNRVGPSELTSFEVFVQPYAGHRRGPLSVDGRVEWMVAPDAARPQSYSTVTSQMSSPRADVTRASFCPSDAPAPAVSHSRQQGGGGRGARLPTAGAKSVEARVGYTTVRVRSSHSFMITASVAYFTTCMTHIESVPLVSSFAL